MQRRHTAALKMLCLIGSLNFSVRSKNNQGELKKKGGGSVWQLNRRTQGLQMQRICMPASELKASRGWEGHNCTSIVADWLRGRENAPSKKASMD